MSAHYLEQVYETADGQGSSFVQAVNESTYFDHAGDWSDSGSWVVSPNSWGGGSLGVTTVTEAKAYAQLFEKIAEELA